MQPALNRRHPERARSASRGTPVFAFVCAISLSALSAPILRAQTIEIHLVNGKIGRPLTHISWLAGTTVQVVVGPDRDLSLLLTADKRGIVPLRFTGNAGEINVPDCKGEQAAWDNLMKDRNKADVRKFNKRYKNCTNFVFKNPVMAFADAISIGSVESSNHVQYVPCWAASATPFSTDEILRHGIVTANTCGTVTASPQPGQLILFIRKPTNGEQWRQAFDL